jgi:hypothetical protein
MSKFNFLPRSFQLYVVSPEFREFCEGLNPGTFSILVDESERTDWSEWIEFQANRWMVEMGLITPGQSDTSFAFSTVIYFHMGRINGWWKVIDHDLTWEEASDSYKELGELSVLGFSVVEILAAAKDVSGETDVRASNWLPCPYRLQ